MIRVLVSGSLASIAAALTLAAASKRERHAAAQPLNATSHWLHGDSAAAYAGVDWPHTGVGYATHHLATLLWAGVFEVLRQVSSRSSPAAVVRDAAIASTAAATVDYTITPHRLTPGWELVLRKRSMALAYAAMAAAFVTAECLLPARKRERPVDLGALPRRARGEHRPGLRQ
jgi:hypothetical protein